MGSEDAEGARRTFDRSLQSLPQFEHIRMISQTALLEFKHGDPGVSGQRQLPGCICEHAPLRSCVGCLMGRRRRRLRCWLPPSKREPARRAAAPTAERGRSLFEGVLRNYPKRLDLWSVYLDQEVAQGDQQRIRWVGAATWALGV